MASRLSLFNYFVMELHLIAKKYRIKNYYRNDQCIIDLLDKVKLRLIYKYPYQIPQFYVYSSSKKKEILYNQYLCNIFIVYNLKNNILPIHLLCERSIILCRKDDTLKIMNMILETEDMLLYLYKCYLGQKIFEELGLSFYPFYKWLIKL